MYKSSNLLLIYMINVGILLCVQLGVSSEIVEKLSKRRRQVYVLKMYQLLLIALKKYLTIY